MCKYQRPCFVYLEGAFSTDFRDVSRGPGFERRAHVLRGVSCWMDCGSRQIKKKKKLKKTPCSLDSSCRKKVSSEKLFHFLVQNFGFPIVY